ncbi:DNA polymerase delta, subunit 4-domain-containing protein [Stachybotrys elegans]|uniref:DNA polymerase delta, subunit 4-domain-containing protein n=1 Tax=Stachybotrys elegans TaxID=80388 RepID=A0A8K0SY63_9HYPO|nr:DNA polymerase delta, subunit 4-domain-containing protein [Stachybotrys elegans]
MPATRRSTGSIRGRTGPGKGQSTISFAHRVTKNVPKDTKKDILAPTIKKLEPTEEPETVEDEVAEIVPKELDAEKEPEAEAEEEPRVKPEVQKSKAEVRAEKITDAQINKYWRAIEAERKAPRVHQQELRVNEKVLRYFDVSSQYGPCVGIARMKRWQRAERLGLKPPIEVLAVLLREEKAEAKDVNTAHMDQILNSIAIGA